LYYDDVTCPYAPNGTFLCKDAMGKRYNAFTQDVKPIVANPSNTFRYLKDCFQACNWFKPGFCRGISYFGDILGSPFQCELLVEAEVTEGPLGWSLTYKDEAGTGPIVAGEGGGGGTCYKNQWHQDPYGMYTKLKGRVCVDAFWNPYNTYAPAQQWNSTRFACMDVCTNFGPIVEECHIAIQTCAS